MIKAAFDNVRRITRTEALKKTDKKEKLEKNKDRIVNPFDYNPRTPVIGPVLNKHYRAMLRKNNSLKKVFPGSPIAGLRPQLFGLDMISAKKLPNFFIQF